jgi:nuclear transport factor 2 (NTF2) superfamily protein
VRTTENLASSIGKGLVAGLAGQWWRGFGSELRELGGDGLMCRREASISDVPAGEPERRISWLRPQSGRQDLPVR